MGRLIRAISRDGGIVLCALDSTDMVEKARRIHSTTPTASAALGRMLTGASLMGCMLKNAGDSVTLRVNGGGLIGTVLAVSDYMGNARGYCSDPAADLPLNAETNKLNVGGAVGTDGYFGVIRDSGEGEPYSGQIPIVSGEIGEEITSYYARSEQIPTACALGVLVDTDGSIKKAGGYLLQLLPGALDEEIDALEQNISSAQSVTKLLDDGMSVQQIVNTVLSGFEPEILDDYNVSYLCSCSRERTERALISLGEKELLELIEEDGGAQIVCNFCRAEYDFSASQLKQLINNSTVDKPPLI